VQFSAQLRVLVGASEERVELPPGSTLAELLAQLAARHAEAAPHLLTTEGKQIRPSLLLVVNDRAVAIDDAATVLLRDGDVVTLLPPIAGG
jgi:MoaD family protein